MLSHRPKNPRPPTKRPDQLQGTIEDLVRSDFTNEESWETQQAINRAISIVGLENHLLFQQLVAKNAVPYRQSNVYETDILLLDEPTNHLDIESIQWLEHYFASVVYCGTYDRTFLRKFATRIIELDRATPPGHATTNLFKT